MSDARTKHVRVYPWRFEELALDIRLLSATFDKDREAPAFHDRHFVDAAEPFDELSLSFEVELAEPTVKRVAEQDAELGILLHIACEDTRVRYGITKHLTSLKQRFDIDLERPQFFGSVLIGASLIRMRDVAIQPPLASHRFSQLADSRPWEIRIDRKRELHGVYLDVRYIDFKTAPNVPEHARPGLHWLEMTSESPVLWVNQQAQALMSSTATSGRGAHVRNVAFDLIAPSIWLHLYMHAIQSRTTHEEWSHPWQEAVFWQIGRLIWPKCSELEMLERLAAEKADLAEHLLRVDSAMQSHHQVLQHLLRLSEDVT